MVHGLSLNTNFFETRLFKSLSCANIFRDHSQFDFIQIQFLKSVVQNKFCGFRASSLSPVFFISDHDSKNRAFLLPINWLQLDITNMDVVIAIKHSQKQGIWILLFLPNVFFEVFNTCLSGLQKFIDRSEEHTS